MLKFEHSDYKWKGMSHTVKTVMCIQCYLDEEESEKSKDTDLRSAIEILSIIIILALSSQIAFLGMIVPIIVVLWARKNKM